MYRLFFAALGIFVWAITIFGLIGTWNKILFISLVKLTHSWETVVIVLAVGLLCEVVALLIGFHNNR
jgi:hypothetical protein